MTGGYKTPPSMFDRTIRDHQPTAALQELASTIMKRHHRGSGFSPPATSPNTDSSSNDVYVSAHSRQASSCVQSTTSEEPVPTRGHLLDILRHISMFASHYASVYFAIGCSYHSLPFSARQSSWVTAGMRQKAAEALITSTSQQLPDLVYIFDEIAHRLGIAQNELHSNGRQWLSSEIQLRRCDMLLQEAEMRLRFLQGAVGSMWFAIGRDDEITWEEDERLIGARARMKSEWACVLPQMCFAEAKLSPVEKNVMWREKL